MNVINPKDRLRNLREAMGLTQREMAEELSVTKSAIAYWELGERAIPGPVLRLIELYEAELGMARKVPSSRPSFVDSALRNGTRVIGRVFFSSVQRVVERDSTHHEIALRARLAIVRVLSIRLGEMPGLGAKLEQMLHGFAFAFSDELAQCFATLSSPKPMKSSEVVDIFLSDFGVVPTELFARWNPTPFATASLGQVHRARTRRGTDVAVKVQYPKIAQTLERDLHRLDVLDDAFRHLFPYQTPRILMKAVRDSVLSECNYRSEAQNQIRMRAAHRELEGVVIPRVHEELSSARVLTSDFEAGTALGSWAETATPKHRNSVGESIARFTTTSILAHHVLLGDPHPENFLVREDCVVVLDFGRLFTFSPKYISEWKALIRALISRDESKVDAIITEWGVPGDPFDFDFDANRRMLEVLFEPWLDDAEFTFDASYLKRASNAVLWENRNIFRMNLLPEIASLHEFHFGVYGVLCRLDCRFNFQRVVRPWLIEHD